MEQIAEQQITETPDEKRNAYNASAQRRAETGSANSPRKTRHRKNGNR